MSLIMPRGPDHPIPLEEWKDFREIVGECQTEMKILLDLAEEDPLTTLLRELTETLGLHMPSPFIPPPPPSSTRSSDG